MQCRSHVRYRKIRHHTGGTSFLPTDYAKILNMPAGYNGSGTKVGIIELGGGFTQSDLDSYFSSMKLTVKPVQVVSVQGATNSPGDPNGADGEVYLDLCVIGGLAPGCQMRCYFAPNTDAGFAAAIQQAVTDGCDAISISWGAPEDQWSASSIAAMGNAIAAAKAAGIVVFAAAGDNGSGDGEGGNHVDFPAAHPDVIGCGGTSTAMQNGQLAGETVWNDGTQGGATGGGVSTKFALPSYQSGVGVPGNGRGVPDVAGNADPETGWLVVIDGQQSVIGGTSAVAPMMAAITAVLVQALGRRLAPMHPLIYPLEADFADITQGNNGTYAAKAGYDCCTGLGRPNVAALLAAMQSGAVNPPPPPPVNTTIQQKIDALFAVAEARLVNNPFLLRMVEQAQGMVDGWLATHPINAATLTQAIQMIFQSLIAGTTNPVTKEELAIVEMILLALVKQVGAKVRLAA